MKFNQFDNLIDSLNTRQSALTKETEAHLDRALTIMDQIDSMFAPDHTSTSPGRGDCMESNTDNRPQNANVCVDHTSTNPRRSGCTDTESNTNNSSQESNVCVEHTKTCPTGSVFCMESNTNPTFQVDVCTQEELVSLQDDGKYHIKPFHPRDLALVTHQLEVLIAESDPHYAHEYFGGE